MEKETGKGYIFLHLETDMKEIGKKELKLVEVFQNMLMELDMMEIGKMIQQMEKE